MSEYAGRKWFYIHRNDAGREAYREEYVQWLEKEIERLREFVSGQPCECCDEYGRPKPHPCERCLLLGRREDEEVSDERKRNRGCP